MPLNHSGDKIKYFIVTHRQCALSWMEMKEEMIKDERGNGRERLEGEVREGRLQQGCKINK